MAGVLTDPKTNLFAQCSARVVTTMATFVAATGAMVMGMSRLPLTPAAAPDSSPAVLACVGVLLTTVVAWFASRLRYGVVMLGCALVGLIPWTRDWWKGDGTHIGGSGLGFATVGVLLTSFVSANSSPALRRAWEQCAPASAAAAGWLLSLSMFLAVIVSDWRWFGPVPLVLGAMLFLALALVSSAAAKERVARGAVPSAYMAGRSFRSVLLLKFFGGAAYVLIALSIIIPSASFIWLMSGGSIYQRSGTESFSDGTRKMLVPQK